MHHVAFTIGLLMWQFLIGRKKALCLAFWVVPILSCRGDFLAFTLASTHFTVLLFLPLLFLVNLDS